MHILCLFDYNCTAGKTGFSRVSETIIPALKKHFGHKLKLDIAAINMFPQFTEDGKLKTETNAFWEDENTFVFSGSHYSHRPHPGMEDVSDPFGRFEFLDRLQQHPKGFDGVFIMQDIGVVLDIVPLMQQIKQTLKATKRKQFKSIYYFPVDNDSYRDLTNLSFFDEIITYTQWGRESLHLQKPDLKGKVKVIPHGLDNKTFYIEPQRKDYSKFIIGNVNRNNRRKNMPDTLLAFKHLQSIWNIAEQQPVLYLHCDPTDPLGFNLLNLCKQLGLVIGEDVLFGNPCTDNELRAIYNSLDCYVTTATGGGWELTVAEAMACGVPCILPAHTSFLELGANNRCIYLNELSLFCNDSEESKYRPRVNIEEVAEKIMDYALIADGQQPVYNESLMIDNNIQKMIDNGQSFVKNNLQWADINKLWINLFKQTF